MAEADKILIRHFRDKEFSDALIDFIEKFKGLSEKRAETERSIGALDEVLLLIKNNAKAAAYNSLIHHIRAITKEAQA